jgi:hypothetical protein
MENSSFPIGRTRRWVRRGAVTGACAGSQSPSRSTGYFVHGAGADSLDAGEAHGLILLLLGFPFSVAVPYGYERVGLILSVGAAWALVGAAVAGAAAAMRSGRATPRPAGAGSE